MSNLELTVVAIADIEDIGATFRLLAKVWTDFHESGRTRTYSMHESGEGSLVGLLETSRKNVGPSSSCLFNMDTVLQTLVSVANKDNL
ncbi:hypothetical protein Tco_1029416 [Tanacetum coccineum]|uniref:Uncharacterized protein n=1 Tax=Tanacetum coccineum TaxID=301880 RepID=A0ABQ5G3C6_9ASTR